MYKLCRSWYKKSKTSNIMSRGKKWAQFEKDYIPSDGTSGTKLWMTCEAGGDISVCQGILDYSNFSLSYNMVKNVS